MLIGTLLLTFRSNIAHSSLESNGRLGAPLELFGLLGPEDDGDGLNTTDVPKIMSNIFLHANWEQQTKESAVVDGTSCCVILECPVTSIACIT